jgi:hypothetical protein
MCFVQRRSIPDTIEGRFNSAARSSVSVPLDATVDRAGPAATSRRRP